MIDMLAKLEKTVTELRALLVWRPPATITIVEAIAQVRAMLPLDTSFNIEGKIEVATYLPAARLTWRLWICDDPVAPSAHGKSFEANSLAAIVEILSDYLMPAPVNNLDKALIGEMAEQAKSAECV